MNNGGSQAPVKITALPQTVLATLEERRSAVAVFEVWQHQWPIRFRGEAWLHLERLTKAISSPARGRRSRRLGTPTRPRLYRRSRIGG